MWYILLNLELIQNQIEKSQNWTKKWPEFDACTYICTLLDLTIPFLHIVIYDSICIAFMKSIVYCVCVEYTILNKNRIVGWFQHECECSFGKLFIILLNIPLQIYKKETYHKKSISQLKLKNDCLTKCKKSQYPWMWWKACHHLCLWFQQHFLHVLQE